MILDNEQNLTLSSTDFAKMSDRIGQLTGKNLRLMVELTESISKREANRRECLVLDAQFDYFVHNEGQYPSYKEIYAKAGLEELNDLLA